MADRPIIFSAAMVRALLEGRKTQTRRVLKEQRHVATAKFIGGRWQWQGWKTGCILGDVVLAYAPGDRLWVREAHWFTDDGDCVPVAGNEEASEDERKRPSIHMPRWASRITLHVSEVRVQRLQEISEADARAEGCRPSIHAPTHFDMNARGTFQALWNSLHGPDAWASNPWVAAISFTVERANIDQARAPHA